MKRVVVAMSGGVDSSVAAYLLLKEGYEVIGITMQIWQDEDNCAISDNGGCCGLSAVEDARNVCNVLSIPHYVSNFKDIFKQTVIDYFITEYKEAKTPNPCIACNQYVKWEALLCRALELEADYIATGHYARVYKIPENNRYCLKLSKTNLKDQTYALFSLTQRQLAHTLMPVGDYTKDEVRAIAKEIGLSTHNKPDSQEICFIPDNNYARFIENSSGKFPEGNFVDVNGKVLGRHKGIIHYTIGQRKGLGISFAHPMYVRKIDAVTNDVTLCENEFLFNNVLYADKINFMSIEQLTKPMLVNAKIRYSHRAAKAVIEMDNGMLKCTFETPQRAITPGQAVAFYDGEILVGGGIISHSGAI